MVGLLGGSASAAHLTVTPEVVAAFDLGFNPVTPIPDISQPVGQPLIYQIDLFFEISGLGGAHPLGGTKEGFGGLSMNIDLTEPPPVLESLGYAGDTSTIQVKDIPPLVVPLWLLNADAGADSADLQDIAIAVGGDSWQGASDPRLGLGESGPQFLGSAYVKWDGQTAAKAIVDVTGFGTVNTDGQAATDPGVDTVAGGEIVFVPEPATITLLGLGAVAMIRRRR